MRSKALFLRIVRQFFHDKRTLALLILAPVLVLSLLYLVLDGENYTPEIVLVDVPEELIAAFEENTDAKIDVTDLSEANERLENGEADAIVSYENNKPSLVLEGSSPTANQAVMASVEQVMRPSGVKAGTEIDPVFLHGSKDLSTFDYYGSVFIGFFAFFFVFLIAGVSFLRERTTGTLERLLASPVRRWEIVIGYIYGFGFFTAIQTVIIVVYAIYVLDLPMKGSFWLVLLTTLLTAFSALTLGTLMSAFANNELQMIQFIPLIIVPQFFFSGVFDLETISDWVSWIGPLTPLYYTADALRDIMIRGKEVGAIIWNLLIIFGFGLVFMMLTIVALRKHRKL